MNLHHILLPLAVASAIGGASPASADAAPVAGKCSEDQSCFSWSTMGNLKRGVTLKSGRNVIVGTCRFQRLSAEGKLARNYVKLNGDRHALRFGCGFDVQAY